MTQNNKINPDTNNTDAVKPKEGLYVKDRDGIYKKFRLVDDAGRGVEAHVQCQIKKFKCKNGCQHYNHLVCFMCNRYFYIDNEELEILQDRLARKNGFKPQKHNFEVFGICAECQDKYGA